MSRILFFIFCLCFAQGFVGASSESGALNPCPECISSDQTASEIKSLSLAACEQVVNSEECQGVNPKYLRDCEEEEESSYAFGQRVLGCMKGAALEGAIGWGVGAVLGKVIVGIGALMSVPFVLPALGVTAGGGAALYIYSEYDRAYQEVGEGEGSRAMRAMGQLLGNVGTGIYRLLLGNYECYSSEGRAWEVCGLLLGGVVGGGAAVYSHTQGVARRVAKKSADGQPLLRGLTPDQDDLLRQKAGSIWGYVSPNDIADLRKAGISMEDIGKAFRLPQIQKDVKRFADNHLQEMATAKKLLGQGGDLSEQQVRGVGDLVESGASGWEQILRGVRRTGLSVDDALSLRRSSEAGNYTNLPDLMKYIQKRKATEQSIRHRFTEGQSDNLSHIQKYFKKGASKLSKSDVKSVRYQINKLVESGLSPRQLREVVDKGLITDNMVLRRRLKEWIDLEEFAKQNP